MKPLMVAFKTVFFFFAFICQSNSVLGQILQDLTLHDESGNTICSSDGGEVCNLKSSEDVTLEFNVIADHYMSYQPASLYIGNYNLLRNAELCYDIIYEELVVITSFKPLFCFIPASIAPYHVKVSFKVPKIKETELTLDVGYSIARLAISVDKPEEDSDVSHEDDSPSPKPDDSSSSDNCPQMDSSVTTGANESSQDFKGPLIVNSGEFRISDVTLLDHNGQETCYTASGNQLCTVYPNQNMSLQFNLSLHSIAVREKFKLFLGNVTILDEARICSDFDTNNVFIQTPGNTTVCTSVIHPSDTPFLVDVPFYVPPFEGEVLTFYLGASRGLLIIQSEANKENGSSGKSSITANCAQNSPTSQTRQPKPTKPPITTTTTEQPPTNTPTHQPHSWAAPPWGNQTWPWWPNGK